MPLAWAGPLPETAPPPGMALYQLPTGTYETRAAFAFRGGSFRDKRHFAATAILYAPVRLGWIGRSRAAVEPAAPVADQVAG